MEALLGWDEMVMMADGATDSRAAQKKVMAGIVHERKTDKEIGTLLQQIESSGTTLDEAQDALVREAKRECGPPIM